jgi:outer membrane protein OmpA-like peptidoglycan-associated protein
MRYTRVLGRAAALVAALYVATPAPVHAQGWGERLKKKAEEAARRAKETRSDRPAEGAAAPANSPAAPATEGAADTTAASAGATAGASAAPVGATAAAPALNVGKDFTPGTRVVFATDFKRDEIGDFPRAFELRSGNFEVADVGGTRFLRATSFGKFEIPLPEVLPEMFTIEFDLKPVSGWSQYLYFTDDEGNERPYVMFDAYHGGIEGPKSYRVISDVDNKDAKNRVFHVQVMADGKYVKVYMDGQRVANAPNADVGRSNKRTFSVKASNDNPVLFGNFRVAAGGKDLYKALEESGRVTAEGIFFDTNSDRIRPESEPVLKQIGDMLAQHADVRVAIEGHTDNVGAAAANQALSEKRAAAVKAHLVSKYGVDAARVQAKGFGASKPVAPNAGEAGRQKNRRVELVKL